MCGLANSRSHGLSDERTIKIKTPPGITLYGVDSYLAYSLRGLGRYEEAIEKLENSLKYGADALTVSLEKAETYRRGGDFGSAGEVLKHLENYEGVRAEYHYQLGRLKEDMGLYDEAVENYRTAMELAPEHQEALFRLACRCDLEGDEEAAIDYYKQIVLRSPVHVNALLNLAVLYEDEGQFDWAGECVEKVLQFYPNHERAILFDGVGGWVYRERLCYVACRCVVMMVGDGD